MRAMCLGKVFAFFVAAAAGHGGSGGGSLDGQSPAVKCPGSPAASHAWLTVELTASASCADVRAEILARVAGQSKSTWRDPHDGGDGKQLYTLVQDTNSEVVLSRLSSNGRFTDKQLFTFSEVGTSCSVTGCSESQGGSGSDKSTNYCNLRNLYCGSAEKCCRMKTDFSWQETKITKSSGASNNADVCLGGSGGSGSGFGGEVQATCLTPLASAPTNPSITTSAGASNALSVSSTTVQLASEGSIVSASTSRRSSIAAAVLLVVGVCLNPQA